MKQDHPASELANRLRSAARTGRRLHLDQGQVAVLMSESIYQTICALEAEEIRQTCAVAPIKDISAENSGSGNDRTMAAGASAGSNVIPLDAASRGARSRLSEAMSELQLRKKQSMH
jgi:hypothetical protein